METIFLAIQQQVETVSGLSTVDIDWGQLEAQDPDDGSYPVFFPCCLIDVPNISWTKSGTPIQPGQATVRLKVGMDMIYDTNKGSGELTKAIAKLEIAKTVHNAVNLFTDGKFSKLIRTGTRAYNIPGGIKVMELEYVTDVIG